MSRPANARSTETLLSDMYVELRRVAEQKLLRERPDHTLQATALVHEVSLRLLNQPHRDDWESRSHFLRVATEAMRRILVDHARARLAQKRGGEFKQTYLSDIPIDLPLPCEELIAIHECIDKFAEEDPVKAELVKLRVFGGVSHQEAAETLGISRATADRYWAYARVRLYAMIAGKQEGGASRSPA